MASDVVPPDLGTPTTVTATVRGVALGRGDRPRSRRRPSGAPPPLPHDLRTSGVGWLVAAVVGVAAAVLVFRNGVSGIAIPVIVVDDTIVRWVSGVDLPGIHGIARGVGYAASWWTIQVTIIAVDVALIALRRWRLLVIFLVVSQVVVTTGDWLADLTTQPRPFGVPLRGSWGGWSMPSAQMLALAGMSVVVLYTLVPEGRLRNRLKWAVAALVAAVALARLHLGIDSPTGIVVGVLIGVSPGVAGFRLFAPSEAFPVSYRRGRAAHLDVGGARGEAIRRAVEDQLGLVVTEVVPVGLAGSAGSTPLRLTVEGGTLEGGTPTHLFGKLYSRTHLRSDRWYKFGRELLYGRLEDEKPFNTVRRLVQQEDYALRVVRDAGVPGARSYGFVELTPEREYLLVTEFLEGGVELGDAEVDEALIDEALGVVRHLWDAGIAHRDIKPANVMVRDGRIALIDVAFAELRPTPWRQAVDLANMMLCLALRSSARQVYDRARRQFTVDEISEAFAAARGLALPSQLRRALRAEGRGVQEEFLDLLPERPRPIRVQRWNARRIVVALATLALVVLVVLNAARVFGNAEATRTPVGVNPRCNELEAMWLQAQAVPTASLVPCVRSLPVGWSFRTLSVNEGRSIITLDHDRAGARAVELRFAETCDVAGADQAPTTVPGARRFTRGPEAGTDVILTRYDVFPGGCATLTLSSRTAAAAVVDAVTAEVDRLVDYDSRPGLARALDHRSDGRLHLDPPA